MNRLAKELVRIARSLVAVSQWDEWGEEDIEMSSLNNQTDLNDIEKKAFEKIKEHSDLVKDKFVNCAEGLTKISNGNMLDELFSGASAENISKLTSQYSELLKVLKELLSSAKNLTSDEEVAWWVYYNLKKIRNLQNKLDNFGLLVSKVIHSIYGSYDWDVIVDKRLLAFYRLILEFLGCNSEILEVQSY